MSSNYQIVSFPLHSATPEALDSEISNTLESKIVSHGVADVFEIGIRDSSTQFYKAIIGTLDSVVLSTDELGKFALNVKSTHDFMVSTMKMLLGEYDHHDPSSS